MLVDCIGLFGGDCIYAHLYLQFNKPDPVFGCKRSRLVVKTVGDQDGFHLSRVQRFAVLCLKESTVFNALVGARKRYDSFDFNNSKGAI